MVETGDCTMNLPFLEQWTCPHCAAEHDRRVANCAGCGAKLRCTVERLPVAICVLIDRPAEPAEAA